MTHTQAKKLEAEEKDLKGKRNLTHREKDRLRQIRLALENFNRKQ